MEDGLVSLQLKFKGATAQEVIARAMTEIRHPQYQAEGSWVSIDRTWHMELENSLLDGWEATVYLNIRHKTGGSADGR